MTLAAIFGLEGTELTGVERDFFRSTDPWGFILFARNVESPDQLRRLTSDLRDAVGRDCLITVDQEGGRVQRLRAPHWAEWAPPLEDARLGAEALRLRYRLIGQELRSVGIDSDCAPTLDIASDATHPFLLNRCLGRDAATVAVNGRAVAEGLLAAGVLPVMKHMPGHGRATADSHHHLPETDAPLKTLRDTDFAPFRALNDLPLGMSAHIRFSALDDAPSTCSAHMVGLIRDEIGFDGLLMTDDISMQALEGSIGARAARAIAAGCDLVLHCHGIMSEMVEVAENAGPMTANAMARAERALSMRGAVDQADPRELVAAFRAAGGQARGGAFG
ncbi:MAG: glycoside hydrolase family 3 N-terminal domain-containing protein [Paracoccus sp. (in: a-proteobacteria)]|nr:glycoside hydrolase family 3 N-terminal domain-containing protein [Paracoccus sp. (in: a-proteobacteria)]